MDRGDFIVVALLIIWCSVISLGYGYDIGKKEQQKTIKTEVHKRCLDSDIYNEFECYNMIIKGE